MGKNLKPVEFLAAVLFLVCIVIGILVALNVAGCQHDGCQPTEQRCRSNNVETCNADEDWYVSEHCGHVEPVAWDWVCCYIEKSDLYACVPADECEVDGGAL